MGAPPRFYYTAHPGDLSRRRLPNGCHVMVVASAHWNGEHKRFRVCRPPADWVASVAIDSGGFTAARRWGAYPWTPAQYAEWVREMSCDLQLDFCATMDYACERGVNRQILATNRARIEATLRNELACREAAPDLPWLPVLQGDTLTERLYDLTRRKEIGLLPAKYAGIGSVCGRGNRAARLVLRFYCDRLPGVRYHGFGLHIGALDDDVVYSILRSWDSYSYTWPRGAKKMDRPRGLLKRPDESRSQYTRRLAEVYQDQTIRPRLERPRQGVLL